MSHFELPPHRLLSIDEVEGLMPGLPVVNIDTGDDYEEDDYEDEDYESETGADKDTVVYFEGDITFSPEHIKLLREKFGYISWAVNGNLNMAGDFSGAVWGSGDLHCDNFWYSPYLRVKGRIRARHSAIFMADDHEVLRSTPNLELETPYLFAWFYDLSNVNVPTTTISFLLCDYGAYIQMGLMNPHFFWQADLFALKPEFCYAVGARYFDAPYWNFKLIGEALKAGESLFVEGFDIRCLSPCTQALGHLKQKQYKEAFSLYKEALTISPAFYPAWLEAGRMLFLAGAYQQAISYLDKASTLFPQKQKDLNNRAADLTALARIRLRHIDEAIQWADFSINSSQNNLQDQGLLYFGYRIRGEAYMLKNDWDKAKTDLEKAVSMVWDNGSANWLLGLIYRHFGNTKGERKYFELAKKAGEKFGADYATHNNADFVYLPPIYVDWPTEPGF